MQRMLPVKRWHVYLYTRCSLATYINQLCRLEVAIISELVNCFILSFVFWFLCHCGDFYEPCTGVT